jgi:hypothetical protein
METQNSQPDLLEELLAEILQDPEVRAEMEKIQPIDVQGN